MIDPHPTNSTQKIFTDSGHESANQPDHLKTTTSHPVDTLRSQSIEQMSESQPSEKPLPGTSNTNHPDASNEQPDSDDATLDLHVRDAHGDPIPNFEFRVIDRGPIRQLKNNPSKVREIFRGKTDATGRSPLITGLKLGTTFEIQVKKDDGTYKLAAIGPMSAQEMMACLKSPRVRFEFNTVSHQGSPGTADKKKQEIIKSHNQIADATPKISRNPDIRPSISTDRDKSGNPKAIIKDGLPNMYGQHNSRTDAPNIGKADIDKVKALIEFGMEQASWRHSDIPSAAIIEQMKSGRYQIAGTKEANGYRGSIGRCNRYVKIALWKAGYSHNNGDIDKNISPARDMGPALIRAGFTDITNQIPDARWAAPGDVIVYEKIGATNHVGHIDIRTYDGYLSDFFETYLPFTKFRVIGIYRKYYDPLPELRMRAFLKVIRSREAETVMKKYGDAATYRALPLSAKIGLMFDNFDTHPFAGATAESTASGAYGILVGTWRGYTVPDPKRYPNPPVPISRTGPRFSPTIQDRIAVASMELHLGQGYYANKGITELGLVRKGEIEKAASLLATKRPYQWTSLPGGTESKYTVSEMMADYDRFLKELTEQ
jgi:muramidase (phage lysozyme)